ncbi:uncharacterized protein LOC142662008 [Rhinoderma darwinii]|uniref:uncharacterized protein LOC142662008 n=1 Tax=Rhinoderma darwinii TaxID=43563 RepID=UPI003F672819
MKILVSSLFLLFLSGTYGLSIPKQDEEQPSRPTLRDSIKNLFRHVLVFGAELVSNWEASEADREAVLSKRADIIRATYFNLAHGISEHMVDIYKDVSKEINETYPVYNNKVIPIFGGFVVHVFQNIRVAVEEIQPYFEKFEEHVKKQQSIFWEEIRPILQSKAKPIIDALSANLQPYIDDVRKEVAAASNKQDGKSPSEQETIDSIMEQNIKFAEFLQKISMFDQNLLKKTLSELEIFNTNA